VHHLPPNVPFPLGAGCGVPFHTAYRALMHKARAKKGEKVLIHGASGGVGLAAVQLAKSKGLYVVRRLAVAVIMGQHLRPCACGFASRCFSPSFDIRDCRWGRQARRRARSSSSNSAPTRSVDPILILFLLWSHRVDMVGLWV
jgi:hypothetical protein